MQPVLLSNESGEADSTMRPGSGKIMRMGKISLHAGTYASALSFVLGGGGTLAVFPPWTWPWWLGVVSIAAGLGIFGWGFRVRGRHFWLPSAWEKPASLANLPVAIRFQSRTWALDAPYVKMITEFELTPSVVCFPDIVITNTSHDQMVSLLVRIVTIDRQSGRRVLHEDPGVFRNRILTPKELNVEGRKVLYNPISVPPSQTVSGDLAFAFRNFDAEHLRRNAEVLTGDSHSLALRVEDAVSGQVMDVLWPEGKKIDKEWQTKM